MCLEQIYGYARNVKSIAPKYSALTRDCFRLYYYSQIHQNAIGDVEKQTISRWIFIAPIGRNACDDELDFNRHDSKLIINYSFICVSILTMNMSTYPSHTHNISFCFGEIDPTNQTQNWTRYTIYKIYYWIMSSVKLINVLLCIFNMVCQYMCVSVRAHAKQANIVHNEYELHHDIHIISIYTYWFL